MPVNEAVMAFNERAYEKLLDEMTTKDDLEVRLGDTLDVKASIGLVVITFLATQTVYFLDKHPSGFPHGLQIASGIFLAAATIAAFVVLWPRNYMLPLPESSGIDRATELREFYAQHENVETSTMISQFIQDEIGWTKIRILANEKQNETKSFWLEKSFYLTAIAMVMNIVTLLYFMHPF
jgi:hypothetical protein